MVTLQLSNDQVATHVLGALKNPDIEANVLTLRNMEAHYAFELVHDLELEFSTCCKIAELVMPFTMWQLIGQRLDQSPYQFNEHIERQSAVRNGIGWSRAEEGYKRVALSYLFEHRCTPSYAKARPSQTPLGQRKKELPGGGFFL